MTHVKLKKRQQDSLVTEEQIDCYHRDGHGLIPQLLPPEEVNTANSALFATAMRERAKLNDYERSVGASGSQFVYDLRQVEPEVWQFITSPRLVQAAAELLDTDRIRILHYNCFFKPAGGNPTPLHQDYLYVPLEAEKVIVAWVPLVNLTAEMGLLSFGSGSHRAKAKDLVQIHQYSPDQWKQKLTEVGLRLTTVGNMQVGDVSFHSLLTLHGAPSNDSQQMRPAVAISYYADDTRIQNPKELNCAPTQSIAYRQHFLREYFPNLKPGDLAHNPGHPLVYQRFD